MPGGVLTIETGTSCNNQCDYCPQRALRAAMGKGLDPGTDELKRRIGLARVQGFEEIAFSGGEPTIRKDLFDLVEYAASMGFQRVSMTTNGRMFAYRDFARRMVDAGLTGVSVSLHGPNPAIHDGLTGVEGSFEQAVAGLKALREVRAEMAGRPDLHTITVLVPANLGHLRETLVLAGGFGVGLHIVQPFILSREVLAMADRFLLSLDAVVREIRQAVKGGLPHGGRVKPYNVPPCLLEGMEDSVEFQESRLCTFRAFVGDLEAPAAKGAHGQFFRTVECQECRHYCPGFRLEHRPEAEMIETILESCRDTLQRSPDRSLTLSSLDLLSPAGVDQVLAGVRSLDPSRLRVIWGGHARSDAGDFLRASRDHGVDEIIILVMPPALRLPDRMAWLMGNLDKIREDLSLFHPGAGPQPALFVVPNMLFAEEFDLDEETLRGLVGQLVEAGGRYVYLVAPEALDAHLPHHDEGFKRRFTEDFPRFLSTLEDLKARPRLLLVSEDAAGKHAGRLEDRLSPPTPPQRWDEEFVRHGLTGTGFGWVMWSYPIWLFHEPEGGDPNPTSDV